MRRDARGRCRRGGSAVVWDGLAVTSDLGNHVRTARPEAEAGVRAARAKKQQHAECALLLIVTFGGEGEAGNKGWVCLDLNFDGNARASHEV